MTDETRVIAIDWSGAIAGARSKIWLAEARHGELVRLECGRDRDEVSDYVVAQAAQTPRLIVGLDFAFSLPAWFLRERQLDTAIELWSLAEREAETWLAMCEWPFWGRPGVRKPELSAHLRVTDADVPSQRGISPKSVFQIGGAGAVGTGSLRGMPILGRLHSAGFCVWPFDPPAWPKVVEIWPRVLTGPVNKSSAECRAAYLHDAFPQLSDTHFAAVAAGSEDAFDAAVSALVMEAYLDELVALPRVDDATMLLEGAIWYPVGESRNALQLSVEGITAGPVRFSVSGLPPKKDGANSMWRKGTELIRLKALRCAAAEAMGSRPPFEGPISLSLRLYADRSAGDLDNFLTGICDGLMAAHPNVRPHIDPKTWNDVPTRAMPNNAIAMTDDAQVDRISAERVLGWSESARFEISVGGASRPKAGR